MSLAHRLHFNLPNLGIPELATALQQPSVPVLIAWASVFAHFAEALLMMTIFGNIIIACARMAGFNLLRNTYRPLESRTVAEFWNRYYYFMELLVEFFFLPAFTRYFKQHRRLRVFANYRRGDFPETWITLCNITHSSLKWAPGETWLVFKPIRFTRLCWDWELESHSCVAKARCVWLTMPRGGARHWRRLV